MQSNSTWLLLILDASRPSFGDLSLTEVHWQQYQEYGTLVRASNGEWPSGHVVEGDESSLEELTSRLTSQGVGSVYIEAQAIEFIAEDTQATLMLRNSNCLDDGIQGVSWTQRAGRFEGMCPNADFGLHYGPASYSVRATKVTAVELHNFEFACDEPECPSGSDRSITSQGVGPAEVQVRQLRFHRIEGEGRIEVSGHALAALGGGGTEMQVAIEGRGRFPLASIANTCSSCRTLQDQTLVFEGDATLAGIRPNQDGRFESRFQVSANAIRIDEASVKPEDLFGSEALVAASVAAASVLALIKFLLMPLFTRLSKDQALEHPRRKQIFEYIQRHPGANFREVARNTSIAAGTVRHHLNVLERAGQVVEHSHGSTVRLFENHGKFQHDWADRVLLREPALGQLHAWLKDNPGSPQKVVLEAMEVEGWSRSTTQHRLSRLVDGGIVSIRLQGRLKLYSVAERPVAPRPMVLGLPGTVPS